MVTFAASSLVLFLQFIAFKLCAKNFTNILSPTELAKNMNNGVKLGFLS